MKLAFKPFKEDAGLSGHTPQPAVRFIPSWFRQMPQLINNEKKYKTTPTGDGNATIKWCNPFLDSLSAGYIFSLENDLQVTIEEGVQVFIWKSGGDQLITEHSKHQITEDMVPEGYNPQPFKFRNDWAIQMPAGYSALFVHPLNRTDLPFYTFSGFVDTDGYQMPVNFPFVIKENFEGIIPSGTPIAQVIPIKRESWISQIDDFDQKFIKKVSTHFHSKIYRAYKNLFWKRKDYK
jgi:hypothetical protein